MPDRCCYNCKFQKIEVNRYRNALSYCQKGQKKKLLNNLELQKECDCKYFERDTCDISTEEWSRTCDGLGYIPPHKYD